MSKVNCEITEKYSINFLIIIDYHNKFPIFAFKITVSYAVFGGLCQVIPLFAVTPSLVIGNTKKRLYRSFSFGNN